MNLLNLKIFTHSEHNFSYVWLFLSFFWGTNIFPLNVRGQYSQRQLTVRTSVHNFANYSMSLFWLLFSINGIRELWVREIQFDMGYFLPRSGIPDKGVICTEPHNSNFWWNAVISAISYSQHAPRFEFYGWPKWKWPGCVLRICSLRCFRPSFSVVARR